MPVITYVQADGSTSVVDAPAGTTVMKAAIANDVTGIVAECGGQAMCATCHVYVSTPDSSSLGEISEDENEMLDCTAAPRTEQSRLSCQLVVQERYDGLTVRVPEYQV
ncbi:2Fe-2S iron-sulfur cluster-binding protein [Nocardioides sp. DS6]|uniref:2Fe-2S iron-sulfur cluster-binding protein n=1 Tax=Nocardioides eburneus TaxID=3231482 RepID=A0ABV3T144_9ACTN